MITPAIIGAIVVVVALWFISAYNGFVRLVNRVSEAWADIEVQLKRRYDLIPNLVSTVKGYAKHESSAFENVTKARAQALSAGSVKEKADAENAVSAALKSVFAVAEAYPELRAIEGFTRLQEELSDTEDKIQASRRFYNANVRDLNTNIQTFPSNVVASMFKFQAKEFFELNDENAREAVKVEF